MQATRRQLILAMTSAAAALALPVSAQRASPPQPLPSPNAPQNQNVPAGLDGAEIPVRNGENVIPPATWLEIKSEAQKLLEMTTDFKKRVDQTNVSATLPLPLVKQAHEIEKLAKKLQRQMKR